MIGIIGFVIGWAITLFILCIKDEIWWRKTKKIKFDGISDIPKLSIGNANHYLKWDGNQLEIRGNVNDN